jgi:hypothetical protein
MQQAVKENNVSLVIDIYENQIINKLHEAVTENPALDEKLVNEYFYKILKAINIMIYTDNSEPDELKYSIIQLEKERTNDQKRIHGESPIIIEFEKFILEKEKELEHAKTDKTISDFFKERVNEGSDYIFDADLLSKIDEKLRGEFIDTNSAYLPNKFLKNEWKYNTPKISWLKKQNSLLYLLFRLNQWKRDFYGGKLSHFISTTFTLKGEELIESNVSKALSKISSKSTSPEIDVISDLLNSIQL